MSDSPVINTQNQVEHLEQRRFANVARFEFDRDGLKYQIRDKSSSHTFQASYAQVGNERDFLVERNTWLQNVGYLWLILGAILTVIAYYGSDAVRPSIWLFIGAGCVIAARWRTVRYTKIPTEKGNLLIIQDEQHDGILAQIEARRVDQLRRWYDFFDAEEDAARQQQRFEWLRGEGALSDVELAERLRTLQGMVRMPEIPGEFVAVGEAAPNRSLN